MNTKLRFCALLGISMLLMPVASQAQTNPDGSINIPVYVTNSPNAGVPWQYVIYVGITGIETNNNNGLLPYMFDTGSPNFFSVAANNPNTNTNDLGFFNFSGNGSPGYWYQTNSNTISLGDSSGSIYTQTANVVNYAQVTYISTPTNYTNYPTNITEALNESNAVIPPSAPFTNRGGTWGNFGAGLYGTNTLATILTQLPLATNLVEGYSINFTTNLTSTTNGSLTIGLSTNYLSYLTTLPGAIILSLLPDTNSMLPTTNGEFTNAYSRAQVSNVLVSYIQNGTTNTTNLPLVLDTGGGASQLIYDSNAIDGSISNLKVSSTSLEPIYTILGSNTAWGSGMSVETYNTNPPNRINSGGYFFQSNIVTFDLADGIVIINPMTVPEPSSKWLLLLGGLVLLGYGVFQRGRPSQNGLATPSR